MFLLVRFSSFRAQNKDSVSNSAVGCEFRILVVVTSGDRSRFTVSRPFVLPAGELLLVAKCTKPLLL